MVGKSSKRDVPSGAPAAASGRAEAQGRSNDVLKNNGISWVQVHFTDLLGGLRSFTVPV